MGAPAYAQPTRRESPTEGRRGKRFDGSHAGDFGDAHENASRENDLSPQALDAARREIDRLVQEIAESAATAGVAAEFFASFVERAVRAIAAEGGILGEKREGRWQVLAR